MTVRIDESIRALIPPLSIDERKQLEANIQRDGCRDPLVIWNGTLIDGHNRYEICTRLGIPFKTVEMAFPDREAAEDWIDANQLGRRNLTPDTFRWLLGRRYNRTKKAHGGDRKSKGQVGPLKESTAAKLAEDHGVSERTVKRAAKFSEEVERTPELKEAIKRGQPVTKAKRAMKEKKREDRRRENAVKVQAQPQLTIITRDTPKFATVTIDPPWDWGDEGDVNQMGRAKPDYHTLSFDDLLKLPVGEFADVDCHLYLWITNRSLPKGFDLISAWGFRYITALTWIKPHFGMGNYFRGQTEHVLFGVKGSQPIKRKDQGTFFHAERGKGHSAKPEAFYALVESCSPGPYLEMFARNQRNGWATWGENGFEHAA